MQSSTAENWAPCACTFDLASAGVLEMTDRVYCEQDMRDFSQKYFKINKIFKPSHKVYKNVKYCKQDIDQTDLHNIVAETDGPVSRCALCAVLPAWLKVREQCLNKKRYIHHLQENGANCRRSVTHKSTFHRCRIFTFDMTRLHKMQNKCQPNVFLRT